MSIRQRENKNNNKNFGSWKFCWKWNQNTLNIQIWQGDWPITFRTAYGVCDNDTLILDGNKLHVWRKKWMCYKKMNFLPQHVWQIQIHFKIWNYKNNQRTHLKVIQLPINRSFKIFYAIQFAKKGFTTLFTNQKLSKVRSRGWPRCNCNLQWSPRLYE